MVVICASVISKSGRILLGRAFVPLSKSRLEGYLLAFTKLVSTGEGQQHTFVETEAIRYVYQPMESVYVLLLTTLNSNIMEDLDTLRLFSKLLPEYCGGCTEAHILARVFELTFGVDELLTWGGVRENITLAQCKTFTDMDSHEEKLQKIIMESKVAQAREESRRKATDIDQMKQQAKIAAQQAAAQAGRSSYNEPRPSPQHQQQSSSPPPPRDVEVVSPAPAAKVSAPVEVKAKVKGMQLSKAKKTEEFVAQMKKEEK